MQKLIKKLEVLVKKYFQYYIHNYIGNKHTQTTIKIFFCWSENKTKLELEILY